MGLFRSVLDRVHLWGPEGLATDAAVLPRDRALGGALDPIRLPVPHEQIRPALEELWTELTMGASGRTGRRGQVLFVCHWSEPAGATTVAIALTSTGSAMDVDLSFCLVDFDLQGRGLSRRLGLAHCMGVYDVANHDVALEPTLVATDRQNVIVLPAGASGDTDETSRHPIRREHARALLRLLAEQHDYVLVDMPPMREQPGSLGWTVPEGRAMLVVPSGRMKCESVDRALATLRRSGVDVAGIVLNRQTFPVPRWLYRWT